MLRKTILAISFFIITNFVKGQCAMCKAVIESNPNGGEMATGINHGILYLVVIPYILFIVVGYLFYKSKKDA